MWRCELTGNGIQEPSLLVEMRRAFDQAFAEPVGVTQNEKEDYIQIRVGSERFAVRSAEIASITRAPRVVPFPTRIKEMGGLASVSGKIVPVYELAAFLGLTPGGTPALLLLVPFETPIALGFEAFEAIARVPVEENETACPGKYIRGIVRLGPALLPLIDIPGITSAIRQYTRVGGATKE